MKTMRKLMALLLMLCTLCSLCAMPAWAEGGANMSITGLESSYTLTSSDLPKTVNVGIDFDGLTYGTDKDVIVDSWTSSNTGVAQYEFIAGTGPTVKIVGFGTTTITCNLKNPSDASKTYTATKAITVTQALESLSANPATLNFTIGEDGKTVTVTPNPNTFTSASAVTWTSSNGSVASVTAGADSKTATISPVGTGTATITASWEGKSAVCAVTVSPSVTGNLDKSSITKAEVSTLTLNVNNGASTAATTTVKWEVTAGSDAVDFTGAENSLKATVTAKEVSANTSVTVKATVNGTIEKTFTITVTPPAATTAKTMYISTADYESLAIDTEWELKAYEDDTKNTELTGVTWTLVSGENVSLNNNKIKFTKKDSTAKITASKDGYTPVTFDVYSRKTDVVSITFNGKTYKNGDTLDGYIEKGSTLTASVSPNNTSWTYTWSVDNPARATISSSSSSNTANISSVATSANDLEVKITVSAKAWGDGPTATVTAKVKGTSTPASTGMDITVKDKNGYVHDATHPVITRGIDLYIAVSLTNPAAGETVTSLTASCDPQNAIQIYQTAADKKSAWAKVYFNGTAYITATTSTGRTVTETVKINYKPVVISDNSPVYNGTAVTYEVNENYYNFTNYASRMVKVDGWPLAEGTQYRVISGQNGTSLIQINPYYIDTLSKSATHTVTIDTANGTATATLRTWSGSTTINGVKTGDDANIALWTILCAMSALGATAAVVTVRRRRED